VAGNAGVDHTTRNALRVLELTGRDDIPVAAGAARPLIRPTPGLATDVHGIDGLGGADLPPVTRAPLDMHAVTFLASTLLASTRPVTVIAIAPLTNIALLLAMHPEAAERIERLVIMGGSAGHGNITPAAEFNLWVDPEAGHRVFSAGLPTTMVGLDVTHRAILRSEDVDGLRAGGRVGRLVAGTVDFYSRYHQEIYGTADTYQHDALAVASVIRPELLTTRHVNVTVEYGSPLSSGATLVDTTGVTGAEPNTHVALDLDQKAFAEFMVERLTTLDAAIG
jgi:inosine-uridine nucleoside N-ribohydrolase